MRYKPIKSYAMKTKTLSDAVAIIDARINFWEALYRSYLNDPRRSNHDRMTVGVLINELMYLSNEMQESIEADISAMESARENGE